MSLEDGGGPDVGVWVGGRWGGTEGHDTMRIQIIKFVFSAVCNVKTWLKRAEKPRKRDIRNLKLFR